MSSHSRRFYIDAKLRVSSSVDLAPPLVRHVSSVLRIRDGDGIMLFNGDGYNYHSTIVRSGKKITARIEGVVYNAIQLQKKIVLVQALIKGERMDWLVQKAVEAGVHAIYPAITDRTIVKPKRAKKKQLHWQRVAISACEQCGRPDVPRIHVPEKMEELELKALQMVLLHPLAEHRYAPLGEGESGIISVGPEGGFSDRELELYQSRGARMCRLGRTILRSETAATIAIGLNFCS